ncbi:Low-affinity iron/zinc ion transport protein fet4 [Mucor lusitanicus]|uniref:Low-affinity iron/zinc ion transport protein fet4 n=1 Tax=Mucor circinelloides f. lusitanicus TaxID=29924 RepID=A0A8H4BF53_MUCCL|nr:Low-affinity iron/zinc ion transport protein fet4 [Mucor lusitanicus]
MTFGSTLWKALSSPGRHHKVECSAPTQFVTKSKTEGSFQVVGEELPHNIRLYNPEERKPLGGRIFDYITQYAGSRIAFVITLILLVAWAIVGAVLGAPETWQIVMQDASSIQCYISDSLLMRQQQNYTYKLLTIISQLRSRVATVDRILRNPQAHQGVDAQKVTNMVIKDDVGDAVKMPSENLFDRVCNFASMAVGSMTSLAIYWGGILAWIGVGHSLEFSDLWQLYINTGVAVELTFTSMFLQNTRRRHMEYLEKCLKRIMETDVELELLLREQADDNEPNPMVCINPPRVSRAIRAIDYYGDVIGTGVGAFISVCVFITWIGIGNMMEWSSDWFLIIGTYTGLVGFVDGFVLRNVYFRQDEMLDEQFNILVENDERLYQFLNIPLPTKPLEEDHSIITRISNWMGRVCALPAAVLFSVIVVLALIAVASAMKWNQTGQLLCNTPTMIIEGFLLIVLIQAHNMSNIKRRVQLHDILIRRLQLLQFAKMNKNVYHVNEKHVHETDQEKKD